MKYLSEGTYTLAEMLELARKKTKQQLERHLISKNYIFTSEGRGKNTIYTIEGRKEVFKPTYPTAMKSYLEYIKDNKDKWEWESDAEVGWNAIYGGQKLKSKAHMIYTCRTQLTELGYIKDLQEQEECKYFIKSEDYKEEITKERFFEEISKRREYKDLLTMARSEETFALDSTAIKEISEEAFWESFAQVGGVLVRIKKRELLKDLDTLDI